MPVGCRDREYSALCWEKDTGTCMSRHMSIKLAWIIVRLGTAAVSAYPAASTSRLMSLGNVASKHVRLCKGLLANITLMMQSTAVSRLRASSIQSRLRK